MQIYTHIHILYRYIYIYTHIWTIYIYVWSYIYIDVQTLASLQIYIYIYTRYTDYDHTMYICLYTHSDPSSAPDKCFSYYMNFMHLQWLLVVRFWVSNVVFSCFRFMACWMPWCVIVCPCRDMSPRCREWSSVGRWGKSGDRLRQYGVWDPWKPVVHMVAWMQIHANSTYTRFYAFIPTYKLGLYQQGVLELIHN